MKQSEKLSKKTTGARSKKRPARESLAKKPAATNGRTVVYLEEPTTPSPLRGILPTPPEVATIVAREVARLPMSDAARQRLTDGLKMQFYFGGHDIAYRETNEGREVLAVGLKEIGRLLKVPRAKRRGMVIGQPPPW